MSTTLTISNSDLGNTGIYQLLCVPTNKTYIGSSANIYSRLRGHRWALRKGCHPNPHLQFAWNKHGEEAFIFGVLSVCPIDKLLQTEQIYIDSVPFELLFNVCPVAGNRRGVKSPCSESTKLNISRAKKGNVIVSEEQRRQISKALTGRKHTPETRAKMRLSQRGSKKHSEESRKLIGSYHRDKIVSQETRDKMSIAKRGRPSGHKGKKHTEATKQKIRLAKLGSTYVNHVENVER